MSQPCTQFKATYYDSDGHSFHVGELTRLRVSVVHWLACMVFVMTVHHQGISMSQDLPLATFLELPCTEKHSQREWRFLAKNKQDGFCVMHHAPHAWQPLATFRLASIPAVPEPDGVLYPSDFNNGTHAPSIAMASR